MWKVFDKGLTKEEQLTLNVGSTSPCPGVFDEKERTKRVPMFNILFSDCLHGGQPGTPPAWTMGIPLLLSLRFEICAVPLPLLFLLFHRSPLTVTFHNPFVLLSWGSYHNTDGTVWVVAHNSGDRKSKTQEATRVHHTQALVPLPWCPRCYFLSFHL